MTETVIQSIRVLIADDRRQARDGLQALMETWPEIEVIGTAADGREAIGMVEEMRPDVVLMDARMPVMDGLEATRSIKERWPQIKVVMLTMYSDHRANALAAGADVFIQKGDPPDRIRTALRRRGANRGQEGT